MPQTDRPQTDVPQADGPHTDGPQADGPEPRSSVDFVLTLARGLRWWIASVMGDNAYARYVEHLTRHHPDDRIPTEREYWRERYAAMDANPGARCC